MRQFIIAALLLIGLSGCTTPQQAQFSHDVVTTETPWSHQNFDRNPNGFTFAIVSDLWGGYRNGIFDVAAVQVNQLRPEFVLSVGDLIDGGSEDRARLHQEWDGFDALAAKINAPFFFAGGNHDLTNPTMREVWQGRYGTRYYHFRYGDALFLILDSEDMDVDRMMAVYHARAKAIAVIDADGYDAAKDMEYFHMPERVSGTIGHDQSAYFEAVIADNADAKWTFLFMHKPTWRAAEGKSLARIEKALEGRNYSVFAGHEHSFSHRKRNGMDYTILGTTGGSQRPNDPNGFDHIGLIHFDGTAPSIAHIRMDGLLGIDGQLPAGSDGLCFQASEC